jgi:hypothetical protein
MRSPVRFARDFARITEDRHIDIATTVEPDASSAHRSPAPPGRRS